MKTPDETPAPVPAGAAEPYRPAALNSPAPTSASPSRRNHRSGTRRRWLPYAGAGLLLALIVAGLWPRPAPIETASATMGSLRVTVNEEGKTRIRQRYTISAPVSGQLQRIPFKAGAELKAGVTVLAVIEPLAPILIDARSRALAEARRETAVANLERAQAAHKFAVGELSRHQQLAAAKTISPQELESVQWRETSAAKELAAVQSALREVEAELLDYLAPKPAPAIARAPVEILSSINGRVLRVLEESSRVVSAGQPLLEIGDPSDLEVVIEVLSRDGAAIVPGTKVELEQWGGAEPLQARVRQVEPAAFTKISALGVEEQRVNLVADILTPVEQRPGLGDAFRVEARIITWEADNVLKVPSGALFRFGDQWAAYTVRSGRAQLQPVKAGRGSGTETQVLEGLKAGDQVIVYPGDRVQDKLRVKPLQVSVQK
jgi:HlyD family secretion protein